MALHLPRFLQAVFGSGPEQSDPTAPYRTPPYAPPASEDARQFLMQPPQQPRQKLTEMPGFGLGLMQLGAGLASGSNWGEGIGRGFAGMSDTMQKQQMIEADKAYKQAALLAKAQGKGLGVKSKLYVGKDANGKDVRVFQDTSSGIPQWVNADTYQPTEVSGVQPYAKPDEPTIDGQMYTATLQDGTSARVFRKQAAGDTGISYIDAASGQPVQPTAVTPWKDPTSGAASNRFTAPVNIRWRDKEGNIQVQIGNQSPTGEVMLQDANGKWVPAFQVAGTNALTIESRGSEAPVQDGAGGIPNATYFDPNTKQPLFDLKEAEAKRAGFAQRSIYAEKQLDNLFQNNPQSMKDATTLMGGLRTWAANHAGESVTAATLSSALREMGVSEGDQARLQASPAFRTLQGILRVDTGAAYTATEINTYWSSFLPSIGDTYQDWMQKQDARRNTILSLANGAGQAGPWLLGLAGGKYPMPNYSIGSDPQTEQQQKGPQDKTPKPKVRFLGFE